MKTRIGCVVLSCLAGMAWGQSEAVSPREQTDWLRRVIPLPKEASIPAKVSVSPQDVKLTLLDDSPAGRQALAQLREVLLRKAGAEGLGKGPEIVLELVDTAKPPVPDAARLAELPNSDQAYLIRPLADGTIVLAARTPTGLFYAASTYAQLLETAFKGDTLSLPLATITDWPDLAERGLWGGSSVRDIEWMAARKMNLLEFHSPHSVDEKGATHASVSAAILGRCLASGVKAVPIISHINLLGSRGVYVAYPELRGKGKKAVVVSEGSELYAPCASQPKLREILADWMVGFAQSAQVRDICCWLGELSQSCECEECVRKGQFVAEAEAFLGAWQTAREKVPDLRIRILLTQGSYNSNEQVLAVIPPEVGVTYYDGGRTYDSSKDPMIYPLLEDFAAKGRWLGCYPQLTPSWRIVSPWTGPQFVKARMTEFQSKHLQCLVGYVVPDDLLYDFNVTAAAEWSWNASGRDEREFAIAWALRQGLRSPELVADWALAVGEIGWDFYGARGVERYFFRPTQLAGLLKSRVPIAYGEGLFRYLPDREALLRNHAKSVDAVRQATAMGSTAMLAESRTLETYYRMVVALADMAGILADNPVIEMPQRIALQQQMNGFVLAGMENMAALEDWERSVGKGAGTGRFRDGVEATANTVAAVGAVLAKQGVRMPPAYGRNVKVGGWELEDFRENNTIGKTLEVTQWLQEPGAYRVTFQYTTGWNGANSLRVALASSPAGADAPLTELVVDEHPGTTAVRNQNNVYRLVVDRIDPGQRYWLQTKFRGTRPQDQVEGKRGCSGIITLEQEAPADVALRIMSTPPLSAEELPIPGGMAFKGKGIKVGVVAGGYGSEGILQTLAKTPGIDAVPVALGRLLTDQCQVIVLPQMRSTPPTVEVVTALEDFVKRGGGLVSTHDAVGYRAMPRLLASICAGGKTHVRNEAWQTIAEHPLTAGLPAKQALPQTYFDHIQLLPGPDGTVVAESAETHVPAVLAGTAGKGRYVACGLLVGTDAQAEEAPATGAEATLLVNTIRWCAASRP